MQLSLQKTPPADEINGRAQLQQQIIRGSNPLYPWDRIEDYLLLLAHLGRDGRIESYLPKCHHFAVGWPVDGGIIDHIACIRFLSLDGEVHSVFRNAFDVLLD